MLLCMNDRLLLCSYCLQQSWGKVMFLHVWFCSQGGLPQCMLGYPSPQSRHPPPRSSACWEILTTSGWYASYWNAFLFWFQMFKWTELCDDLNWTIYDQFIHCQEKMSFTFQTLLEARTHFRRMPTARLPTGVNKNDWKHYLLATLLTGSKYIWKLCKSTKF